MVENGIHGNMVFAAHIFLEKIVLFCAIFFNARWVRKSKVFLGFFVKKIRLWQYKSNRRKMGKVHFYGIFCTIHPKFLRKVMFIIM